MTKQIQYYKDAIDKPTISIIAAVAENRAIGKNNRLLWNIPDDMKHFKTITFGHPVIMGQKTFESLPGLLDGRTNIVLTNDPKYRPSGVEIANSIDKALRIARNSEGSSEVFFIGGGMVYKQAMPLADKIYLTIVEGDYDADTYFPDYSMFIHKKITGKGRYRKYKYKFVELKK